jgi:hypothetical protein
LSKLLPFHLAGSKLIQNACVHLLAEINDIGEENKKVYKMTDFKKSRRSQSE